MDKFSYSVAIAEIDAMTTLGAKDTAIRRYVKDITPSKYSSWMTPPNFKADNESSILLYKLITKLIGVYDASRLPFKISSYIETLQPRLLEHLIRANAPFEKYVEALEFDTKVRDILLHVKDYTTIVKAFGDNRLTIPTNINLRISDRLDVLYDRGHTVAQILQLEEVKLRLKPQIRHSILEDTLAKLYTTARLSAESTVTATTDILDVLTTITTTMHKRLND